ncbi:MAG: type II secretion system F family protein [Candidatus Saelkia tenebricola]|nr:type II secretion system F family protein [Candidatus Saelkia tenebricola]
MKYHYKAKVMSGELQSGTIEAESDTEAVEILSRKGYYILSLTGNGVADSGKTTSFLSGKKIKTSDLVIFVTQVADLLDAGISLLRALEILKRQFRGQRMGEIIGDIANEVKGGANFHTAVNKYKDIFPLILPSLIRTGEMSGNLDRTLKEAGKLFQRDEELKMKVKTASIYPLMITIMGIITVFVLLSFVIPKISQVFLDMGGVLPLPTQILLVISGVFCRFWPFIITGVILGVYFFKKVQNDPEKKVYLDRIYLKIPVVKKVIEESETLRFSRTLGILLQSGVPILQAMENTESVLNMADLKKTMSEVRILVRDGMSLSRALEKKELFSSLVQDIISVGEEGGKLDESLINVADMHEKRLDYTLKIATQLIEPILILIIGFAIGVIVIAMLLPLFKLNLLIQ